MFEIYCLVLTIYFRKPINENFDELPNNIAYVEAPFKKGRVPEPPDKCWVLNALCDFYRENSALILYSSMHKPYC